MYIQADEEVLLLEAIDMAGFGNWTAVADHVGTKTKDECKVNFAALPLLPGTCCNHTCSLAAMDSRCFGETVVSDHMKTTPKMTPLTTCD